MEAASLGLELRIGTDDIVDEGENEGVNEGENEGEEEAECRGARGGK